MIYEVSLGELLVQRSAACEETYDDVPEDHQDETHTCDLGADHERAHRCPSCGTRWTTRRSYHDNHPYR